MLFSSKIAFSVLCSGDMRYESAALAAMQALHNARFRTGLVSASAQSSGYMLID